MTTAPTQATQPKSFVDVVFDGPPSAQTGRFVECEDPAGCSYLAGQWIDRGNGLWALRISLAASEVRDVGELTDEQILLIGRQHFKEGYDTTPTTLSAYCDSVRSIIITYGLATRASEAAPKGRVHVPMLMTRAMREVVEGEDWQWEDVLAAAEAVTADEYNAIARAVQIPGEAAPVAVGDAETLATDLYRAAHYGTLGEFHKLVRASLASQAAPDAKQASEPVVARGESLGFELTRSIIHKCSAIRLPQTWLQKLGATAQILPLYDLPQTKCEELVRRVNAGDKSSEYWIDRLSSYGQRFIFQLDSELDSQADAAKGEPT